MSRIITRNKDLTAREAEVARLTADGNSNKKTAKLLGISEGTVKIHLSVVYEKLGCTGRMMLQRRLREKDSA